MSSSQGMIGGLFAECAAGPGCNARAASRQRRQEKVAEDRSLSG